MVGYTQMVVYMQQHQQGREGAVEQADLSAFIRNTVTIHSLITDRIDRLRPSQQLTLKVRILCLTGTHNQYNFQTQSLHQPALQPVDLRSDIGYIASEIHSTSQYFGAGGDTQTCEWVDEVLRRVVLLQWDVFC